MIDRYSREEIKRIWDLEEKFKYYLKVELGVCEAYHKLGTEKVKSLRFVKKSIENALISLESDKTIE